MRWVSPRRRERVFEPVGPGQPQLEHPVRRRPDHCVLASNQIEHEIRTPVRTLRER
jgi:hypothetical protein